MKGRVWAERGRSPAWASKPIPWIWRYKVTRGTVTRQGITLTWRDALSAVERHLRGA